MLAEVYLAMTRGQNSLTIDLTVEEAALADGEKVDAGPLADIIVLLAATEELAEHEAMLKNLDKEVKGSCIWRAATAN